MKKILCIVLFCIMLTGCAKTPVIEEAISTEVGNEIISNEIIYNYNISDKTASEIVEIVNRYIETLPQSGDTYHSVLKHLKVEPFAENNFSFYYVKKNNKPITAAYDLDKINGDYIISIEYPNVFMEMDNEHIGCSSNDPLKIQMVFSSYDRVEPIFVSLTNYYAVEFDNKKNDMRGTYWYTYLYNDSGYRYVIDLTYSDGLEGYILNFKIEA